MRKRCEDNSKGFRRIASEKKAKTKKLNQELLYNKRIERYFNSNTEENNFVLKILQDSNINVNRPTITYS